MSTRNSIVFVGPLHIYEEMLTEQLCVDLNWRHEWSTNVHYKDPIITKEQLIEIKNSIEEYLGEND